MKPFMHRDVAITALKEILDHLPELRASAVTLMSSNPQGKGYYHIHISAELDENSRTCIKEIASKYSLVYRENEGRILIYKKVV